MEYLIKFLKDNGHYNQFLEAIRLDYNKQRLNSRCSYPLYNVFNDAIAWGYTEDVTGINWRNLHNNFSTNSYSYRYTYEELFALKKSDSNLNRMLKFARSQSGNTK